jgi:hypothetical protein
VGKLDEQGMKLQLKMLTRNKKKSEQLQFFCKIYSRKFVNYSENAHFPCYDSAS